MTIRFLATTLICAASLHAGGAVFTPPQYTVEGIVNAASYSGDALAPNTIASVFGTNLSYVTRSVGTADSVGGELPTSLGGVTVYVANVAAVVFYVSPTQINFLVPSILPAGKFHFYVIRESLAGPDLQITLHDSGPGFFQDYHNNILATHLDGTLVSDERPAGRGEWVVAYCSGLGRTSPNASMYTPALSAAPIQTMEQLVVTADGSPLPPEAIYYAGLTPGFAGLYQINLKLPEDVGPNPELRIRILDQESAENRRIPLR
jgi:uncharacterized protein (TIGR03437 family)